MEEASVNMQSLYYQLFYMTDYLTLSANIY